MNSPLQHFVIVADGEGGEKSGVAVGRWERALQKLAARRRRTGRNLTTFSRHLVKLIATSYRRRLYLSSSGKLFFRISQSNRYAHVATSCARILSLFVGDFGNRQASSFPNRPDGYELKSTVSTLSSCPLFNSTGLFLFVLLSPPDSAPEPEAIHNNSAHT